MIIETKRLILRKMTLEDQNDICNIVADEQTMKFYRKEFLSMYAKRWITWNLENYEKYGFGLWAMILKDTGELIGDCGITIQNIDGELLPEIGYHINRNFWRQGYGKEAATAVRDWAFNNTKYECFKISTRFFDEEKRKRFRRSKRTCKNDGKNHAKIQSKSRRRRKIIWFCNC
jgi:RimJ/RimL family protein N-acetyltransferase